MQEDIVEKILAGRNLSRADQEIINAFSFSAAMRAKCQKAALDAEDPKDMKRFLQQELEYSREMRAWADKRKDLFGDEQLKTVGTELSEEEQKKKDDLAALRKKSKAG